MCGNEYDCDGDGYIWSVCVVTLKVTALSELFKSEQQHIEIHWTSHDLMLGDKRGIMCEENGIHSICTPCQNM